MKSKAWRERNDSSTEKVMSMFSKAARQLGATLVVAGAFQAAAHAATSPRIADHSIDANGVELHYLEAGHGSDTPVVLLHGYAEPSHMWLPLIPQLDDRRVVIAPDLPGASHQYECAGHCDSGFRTLADGRSTRVNHPGYRSVHQ